VPQQNKSFCCRDIQRVGRCRAIIILVNNYLCTASFQHIPLFSQASEWRHIGVTSTTVSWRCFPNWNFYKICWQWIVVVVVIIIIVVVIIVVVEFYSNFSDIITVKPLFIWKRNNGSGKTIDAGATV
jgi:hypothetical protein